MKTIREKITDQIKKNTDDFNKKQLKYKHVNILTYKGLKEAEKLHSSGWRIISNSFCTVIFESVN